MQSSSFLRERIAQGDRTSECWAEIKVRNERLAAASRAIGASDGLEPRSRRR